MKLPFLLPALAVCSLGSMAWAVQTAPSPARRHGPVQVLSGAPGAPGVLQAYDEFSGGHASTQVVADLMLLPIDFVGRVEILMHMPDRPRYLDDVPGASRLVLPEENGVLYRYVRSVGATSVYGFLHVRADGTRALHLERRGTGSGHDDPFVARIAVAPDGGAILVATTRAAGGDLHELDLASGKVEVRTAGVPPIAFSDAGAWLADDWGFAVSRSGVWRFERASGAAAQLVPFQPGEEPAYFSGEAVTSLGRTFAATTAGAGPLALHAYVFGRTGPARRASSAPAPLSSVGFLPDALSGPYLAVSDDGARCAWRVEGAVSRECFLARVEVQQGEQISADAYYTDTLDEIGQMVFFQARRLHMVIGDLGTQGAGSGIESADVFHVDLADDLSTQFTNVTLSSGDATVPFLTPGVIELELIRRIPGASGTLVYDGNGERLYGVFDAPIAPQVVLDQVKDVYFAEPVGGWVAFAARRTYEPRPREIYRVPATLDATATLLVPGNDSLDYPRAWAGFDGWLGYRTIFADVVHDVHRVNVVTGLHEEFPSNAPAFGDAIGFTPWGAMLVREGADGAIGAFWAWPVAGAPVLLATPPLPGAFLPGR